MTLTMNGGDVSAPHASAAGVLAAAAAALERRIAELEPYVEEYQECQRALGSLTRSTPRRGVGRPRGSGRRQQVLEILAATPGIKASDVARQVKGSETHIYRLLQTLERDGLATYSVNASNHRIWRLA